MHGALLDAQLLAEVYLAITREQNSLLAGSNGQQVKTAVAEPRRQASGRQGHVIAPTDTEQQAFDQMLDTLRKSDDPLVGTNWVYKGDAEHDWFPGQISGPAVWVLFNDQREVWVSDQGCLLNQGPSDAQLIGSLDGRTFYAARVQNGIGSGQWSGLRATLLAADHQEFMAISAGIQRLEFAEEHRFCGRCGHATETSPSDIGMRCSDPDCGLVVYPRVAPSVIVLVIDDQDRALLGRSPRFVEGMYSTLAGFIEAGESAEHAIRREIYEEVGVRVKDPVYFGTQSWPFKHSLMMGYFAKHGSGDVRVDGVEIEDARFFSRDQLPPLPPSASISRALIETWRMGRAPR